MIIHVQDCRRVVIRPSYDHPIGFMTCHVQSRPAGEAVDVGGTDVELYVTVCS